MRLNGKIALVTGAGSGIGRALAIELAQLGAKVLLVGRRADALEATRELLPVQALGIVMPADITDAVSREALVAAVMRLGALDLLVNNAGLVESGPALAKDAELRRKMVDTNLLAPMELTLALLPVLELAKPSRIINVGSMFGDIGFPLFAAYSATKFGLRGWSEALRRELAPRGIGVTYAAPRGTRTGAVDDRLVQAFEMRLDEPGKVARAIVGGAIKGARDVYPRGPERLFVAIQRMFPAVIDGALAGQLKRALSQLALTALLAGGVAFQAFTGQSAQAADLTVSVSGVRDATANIRIALYGDPDSFRHEQRATQVVSLPAQPGVVTGVFRDIPAGRYAVLAYHDENDNQKLDLFLGMFPVEGWGLSNDPTVIGPPKFDDSAFDLPGSGASVNVPLHY